MSRRKYPIAIACLILGLCMFHVEKAASAQAAPLRVARNTRLAPVTQRLPPFKSLLVMAGSRLEIIQGKKASLTIEADDNVKGLVETSVKAGTLRVGWKLQPNTLIGNGRTQTIVINGRNIVVPAGSSNVSISNRGVTINGVLINPNRPIKLINIQQPIFLKLTVPDLDQIIVTSNTLVTCRSLRTQTIKLVVSGSGQISLASLQANTVAVRASDAGKIAVSGRVAQQSIRISDSGNVNASRLFGKSADVSISDAGSAYVSVTGKLDAEISDAGTLRYSGAPNITKLISDAGRLIRAN